MKPKFFPITMLADGFVGLDLDKMSNDDLRDAYKQFRKPSNDWEREEADKRELARICDELHHRGI